MLQIRYNLRLFSNILVLHCKNWSIFTIFQFDHIKKKIAFVKYILYSSLYLESKYYIWVLISRHFLNLKILLLFFIIKKNNNSSGWLTNKLTIEYCLYFYKNNAFSKFLIKIKIFFLPNSCKIFFRFSQFRRTLRIVYRQF